MSEAISASPVVRVSVMPSPAKEQMRELAQIADRLIIRYGFAATIGILALSLCVAALPLFFAGLAVASAIAGSFVGGWVIMTLALAAQLVVLFAVRSYKPTRW